MSDMIERVAKEIYRISTARDDYAPAWDDASQPQRAPAFALARAALSEVRDIFWAVNNSSLNLAADEIDDELK